MLSIIILVSFYSKIIAQEIIYIDFLEIIVKYSFYIMFSSSAECAESLLKTPFKFHVLCIYGKH